MAPNLPTDHTSAHVRSAIISEAPAALQQLRPKLQRLGALKGSANGRGSSRRELEGERERERERKKFWQWGWGPRGCTERAPTRQGEGEEGEEGKGREAEGE